MSFILNLEFNFSFSLNDFNFSHLEVISRSIVRSLCKYENKNRVWYGKLGIIIQQKSI